MRISPSLPPAIALALQSKKCNGMIVSRLPEGPTAFFKVGPKQSQSHRAPTFLCVTMRCDAAPLLTSRAALALFLRASSRSPSPRQVSNVQISTDLERHGNKTSHTPEIILNNFGTRLGRRVGRFLGSLFPHDPQFRGRQVVTFHNQRDFIFVRHHRYIFEENDVGSSRPPPDRRTQLCPHVVSCSASSLLSLPGCEEAARERRTAGKERKKAIGGRAEAEERSCEGTPAGAGTEVYAQATVRETTSHSTLCSPLLAPMPTVSVMSNRVYLSLLALTSASLAPLP